MVAPFEIAGARIGPGEYQELSLKVSEFYTSQPANVPVFVKRGTKDGPVLFVTAAVHGDEINGVQIVRDLIIELKERDIRGTFVGVPVVNRFGFIHHQRDMPDNRDLNRSFPGKADGSLASRYAHRFFSEIVKKCTHGIDIHTAGASRTNLPQVRCDIKDATCRRMAKAFGTTVVLHHRGGKGTLRRAATQLGIPTIIYEAGETFKFERDVVLAGRRGVLSVMAELGMIDHAAHQPAFQLFVKQSNWVRSDRGGLLDVYVRPGDLVYGGDEIAVVTNPFGREKGSIKSPHHGLIIGRVTLPLVQPGNPIAHMVRLEDAALKVVEQVFARRTAANAVPFATPTGFDESLRAPGAPAAAPLVGTEGAQRVRASVAAAGKLAKRARARPPT